VASKVPPEPSDQALCDGILARQRRALARAITLVESTRADHQVRAVRVLETLLPHTGHSIRVGITGSPGAGKSTFIEALGLYLITQGHRVAVLAVDPSSSRSGGSILGDKTRMERLAQAPNAFIRPSPSGGTLGGLAEKTREAMLFCEAAGFDVILIETVGVGQSETALAATVDIFVLLELPNAGDDLQAIKRGIIELADVVVITKADIDPKAARLAQQQFAGALAMLRSASPWWRCPVLTVSAAAFLQAAARSAYSWDGTPPVAGTGLDSFWATIERYREVMTAAGELQAKRQRQAVEWMWTLIDRELHSRFRHHPKVRQNLDAVSRAVAEGSLTPAAGAYRLLGHLGDSVVRSP
jgi:LAO/AO transport system kinase